MGKYIYIYARFWIQRTTCDHICRNCHEGNYSIILRRNLVRILGRKVPRISFTLCRKNLRNGGFYQRKIEQSEGKYVGTYRQGYGMHEVFVCFLAYFIDQYHILINFN